MKLSYNEIRNITFGAVEIFESNEGIHFRKCTQKQIEAWGEIEQVLGERAAGTTGVTLEFHTNSSWVEFHVLGRKFELLINGVLAQQVLGRIVTRGKNNSRKTSGRGK